MTYASVVAADAPVAWWKLNDTSGTTAVDSGSGTANNGTYTGTAGIDYELNKLGIDDGDAGASSSVWFKGIAGYVTAGTLAAKIQFAAGTNFTIEAWVGFDGTIVTPGASVLCEAFAGDGNVRYMLGFHNGSGNSRKPSFGWYNGAWRLVNSTTDLVDGGWHHLVGTYDGGTNQLELWLDKVSQGTLTPGGTQPAGTETLYIGRRWDNNGDNFFNGFIDEVAMYSTKLSSVRIAAHYDAHLFSTAIGARLTQDWLEVVSETADPKIRVSQNLVEAVVTDSTPGLRVGQTYIEVVCERDYAGWGTHLLDESLPATSDWVSIDG